MAQSKKEQTTPRRAPATTPEESERRLIAKATTLAEKQLDDGTASAQLVTHLVKLGSSREQLEQERLAMEVQFMGAKMETLASEKRTEELVGKALEAFISYTGKAPAITDGNPDEYD